MLGVGWHNPTVSVFLDLADAIVARLNADATISAAGVEAMTDRQQDLQSKLKAVLDRLAGSIVVTFGSFENADVEMQPPRVRSTYTVSVVTKPILRDGETPAHDILEAAMKSLHGWEPDSAELRYYDRLEVSTGRLLQDPDLRKYLIHQFQVRAITQILP